MIKETHLSAKKRTIPKGDLIFDISGSRKGRRSISPLAPSHLLLEDWDNDRMRWKEYVEKYFLQLYHDQTAGSLLEEIISISMERDVWLVGLEKEYPCHRFLLMQILEKVLFERKVIASVTDADLALVVTEPTVAAAQGFSRVSELTAHLGVPTVLCINRWDLNPSLADQIEADAQKRGISMAELSSLTCHSERTRLLTPA